MKIIICTFGTRGDVQPFVGLSIALKAAGHHPIIATSPQFRSFVEEYGIQWADLHTPDPKAGMYMYMKSILTLLRIDSEDEALVSSPSHPIASRPIYARICTCLC